MLMSIWRISFGHLGRSDSYSPSFERTFQNLPEKYPHVCRSEAFEFDFIEYSAIGMPLRPQGLENAPSGTAHSGKC